MKDDRNTTGGRQQEGQQGQLSTEDRDLRKRTGSFNEISTKDQKSTSNVEEEADLEQERKEAMSERD